MRIWLLGLSITNSLPRTSTARLLGPVETASPSFNGKPRVPGRFAPAVLTVTLPVLSEICHARGPAMADGAAVIARNAISTVRKKVGMNCIGLPQIT